MQTTHTMSFNRYANIPLGALIVLYLALALLYVYATPIYEAPDELYHFALVEHVARTGELPIQNQRRIGAWKQEGSQPPLYYLLSAPLVRLFNTDDFRAIQPHNPHVNMGIPGAVGNKNRILHDAPYSLEMHGARAATYANRLISVLLGAVTVYAVYQAARTFAPNQRHFALLAAGLTAFNPQFLFITAAVNNDSLVTALNSLTLWQTLVMLRDGFKTRRSVILALLVALATLSKLSGLVMWSRWRWRACGSRISGVTCADSCCWARSCLACGRVWRDGGMRATCTFTANCSAQTPCSVFSGGGLNRSRSARCCVSSAHYV